jgi:hypothetical protein
MCPSTEPTGAQREFAADVLRKLLRYTAVNNSEGRYTFLISHAWTQGSMMYLVYKAPPSDITWGLARDTRESMINPSPWQDVDEAVLYYYMLDFEEDWPGSSSRQPGEPDAIRWYGDPQTGLPERPSDIPAAYRHTPSREAPSAEGSRKRDQPDQPPHPRRYADPL